MSQFGLGYKPDPAGHLATSFAHFKRKYSLPKAPRGFADLAKYAPPVMDQGQTGSCTGHAASGASYTSCAAQNRPLSFVPSPTGIYDVGRCIDRLPNPDGSLPPLTDDGAMPNQIWRGISEWGTRPIQAPTVDGRYSDADPATINNEPSFDELLQDEKMRLIGEYRIDSSGDQRIVDFCLALDVGYAITVAVYVDAAFENWDPTSGPLTDRFGAPNHYIFVYAYRTESDGKRVFRFRNSWGESWGLSGDGEADEAFIKATVDAYVAAVEPQIDSPTDVFNKMVDGMSFGFE